MCIKYVYIYIFLIYSVGKFFSCIHNLAYDIILTSSTYKKYTYIPIYTDNWRPDLSFPGIADFSEQCKVIIEELGQEDDDLEGQNYDLYEDEEEEEEEKYNTNNKKTRKNKRKG